MNRAATARSSVFGFLGLFGDDGGPGLCFDQGRIAQWLGPLLSTFNVVFTFNAALLNVFSRRAGGSFGIDLL